MKRKTIKTLSVSLAAVALLASCSGKQINRSDALTLLTTMSDTVTASTYVLPVQWGVAKATGSSLKEIRCYNKSTYFYAGKVGTLSVSSSTSDKIDQQAWAFVKDNILTLAYQDGDTKTLAKNSMKYALYVSNYGTFPPTKTLKDSARVLQCSPCSKFLFFV